jgi:hypothetical protein
MKTLKEVCAGIKVHFHRIGFDPQKEQTRFVAEINGQTFDFHTGLFACIPEKIVRPRWDGDTNGLVITNPLKRLEVKLEQAWGHNYGHIYKMIRQGHVKAAKNIQERHVMHVFNEISALARPTAYDLLSCIRLDSSAEGQSFSQWCGDFGYDDDSISALKTYNDCLDNAKKLRQALGNETFKELMEAQDE